MLTNVRGVDGPRVCERDCAAEGRPVDSVRARWERSCWTMDCRLSWFVYEHT